MSDKLFQVLHQCKLYKKGVRWCSYPPNYFEEQSEIERNA